MPDVYKKIENRIGRLKEKEELWKGRYKEITQQLRELLGSNSELINEMQSAIKNFEARVEGLETETKKANERNEYALRLTDRKIRELSEFAKNILEKFEEKGNEIKKIRSDLISQVNSMIGRHEKTFNSVIEKINFAVTKMQNETMKEEGIYDKMEATKRFMEKYRPPEIPQRVKEGISAPSVGIPVRIQQDPPPAPERFEKAISEMPLVYDPDSPTVPRKPVAMDDMDDDIDVDDIISGGMKGFKDSVNNMHINVNTIAEKLASIEEKVENMQNERNIGVERLDDKIRMYRESVADLHSRMETVEKAMRDGITPMVESLNMLTQTVKAMKEEPKPSLQKPKPPGKHSFATRRHKK